MTQLKLKPNKLYAMLTPDQIACVEAFQEYYDIPDFTQAIKTLIRITLFMSKLNIDIKDISSSSDEFKSTLVQLFKN